MDPAQKIPMRCCKLYSPFLIPKISVLRRYNLHTDCYLYRQSPGLEPRLLAFEDHTNQYALQRQVSLFAAREAIVGCKYSVPSWRTRGLDLTSTGLSTALPNFQPLGPCAAAARSTYRVYIKCPLFDRRLSKAFFRTPFPLTNFPALITPLSKTKKQPPTSI